MTGKPSWADPGLSSLAVAIETPELPLPVLGHSLTQLLAVELLISKRRQRRRQTEHWTEATDVDPHYE